MKSNHYQREEATEELAQILFHTYWSNARGFYRESDSVKEEWRKMAMEALRFTHRFYIDQEEKVS